MAMARCKNCGRQIEDNCSVCPTCGQINPIKSKKVKTVDITTQLDKDKPNLGNYNPKRRSITVLLFCILGFAGIPYFYLKDRPKALISIFSTLIIVASAVLLGQFVLHDLLLPLIIAIIIVFGFNIAVGLRYLTHHEAKDGKGEFLI